MKKVSELKGYELEFYVALAEGLRKENLKLRRGIRTNPYFELCTPLGKSEIKYLDGGAFAFVGKYKLGIAHSHTYESGVEVWGAVWPCDDNTSAFVFRDGARERKHEAEGSSPCEAICRLLVQVHIGLEVPGIREET